MFQSLQILFDSWENIPNKISTIFYRELTNWDIIIENIEQTSLSRTI